jgi:hypothetical protein
MTDESGRARDGNGSARDAGGRRTHDRPRLMRDAEEVRGVALAGSTAKLGENAFLMRLSAVEAERNVRLLKERSWLTISIVYDNGRRALIAIEKGADGSEALEHLFARWEGLSSARDTGLPADKPVADNPFVGSPEARPISPAIRERPSSPTKVRSTSLQPTSSQPSNRSVNSSRPPVAPRNATRTGSSRNKTASASANPGATNKCNFLQARCAIEAGGYCNAATGYAQYMGYEHAHMRYNDCISRGLASR